MGDRVAHLDANVLIALLNADDAHHSAVRSALESYATRRVPLGLSAIAYVEVLTGPMRAGTAVVSRTRRLIAHVCTAEPRPFDTASAITAARMRAEHKWLRTADAAIVACAQAAGASLLTTDKRLSRLPGVELI